MEWERLATLHNSAAGRLDQHHENETIPAAEATRRIGNLESDQCGAVDLRRSKIRIDSRSAARSTGQPRQLALRRQCRCNRGYGTTVPNGNASTELLV